MLPIETITPQYAELTIDRTTRPVPTVPWQLIKVDPQENRIYLSASSSGCSHPRKVRVTETPASIEISVTGTGGGEPCSMQYETLTGYIQLGSIGDRQVTGNTPVSHDDREPDATDLPVGSSGKEPEGAAP